MQLIHSLTSNLVIVALCSMVLIHATDKTDKEEDSLETFRPTREWQVLKKGQPIPKGLHVRVNFETGITEAKLLDPEEPGSRETAVSAPQEEILPHDGRAERTASSRDEISYEALRDAMRNIHGDDNDAQEAQERVKKFRTAGQLEKDLKDMNMRVKSDFELIRELVGKFATSPSDEGKVATLTDLEYLVHQFDNAREFIRLNGFIDIIHPSFNASNVALRSEAIRLLGSAAQSNPQVQLSAMSTGSIQLLLRSLLYDKNPSVKSVALFAISCLVRNYPAAQQKMMSEGGLTVFSQVFDLGENEKLRVKLVTLLNDLVQEKRDQELLVQDEVKLGEYRSIGLEAKLAEAGWCERVPSLLTTESSRLEDDVVEKVMEAMVTLVPSCRERFRAALIVNRLDVLKARYEEEYNSDMLNRVNELRDKLKRLKIKEEL